jgi:hypothetical protein
MVNYFLDVVEQLELFKNLFRLLFNAKILKLLLMN